MEKDVLFAHIFLLAVVAGGNNSEISLWERWEGVDPESMEQYREEPPPPSPVVEVKRNNEMEEKIQRLLSQIDALERNLSSMQSRNDAMQSRIDEINSKNIELISYALHKLDTIYDEIDRVYECSKSRQECELEQIYDDIDSLQTELDQVASMYTYSSHPGAVFYSIPYKCKRQVGVEVLAWTVKESELDFAVRGGTLATTTATGAVGSLISAEYDWRPGFRVYADFTSYCDYWNLLAEYTFFHCSGSDTVVRRNNENLQGTFHQVTTSLMREAASDIHLHYHTLDLVLGRHFQPSSCLVAKIAFGGIGAWIKQKWDVVYFASATGFNDFDIDWEFEGGGLKAAAALDWFVGRNWSLYTGTSLASLIGWYRNTMLQSVVNIVDIPDFTPFNSKNDQCRFVQTFQIKLGPTWSRCFRRFNARIYALYELNAWFNLHEVDRSFITGDVNDGRDSWHVHGLLGLHGFTFGLQATF